MTLVILYDTFITMIGVTTVTTKGQVTIPEMIRQTLAISVGDKIAFTDVVKEGRQVTIKVIPSQAVEKLAGSLKSPVQSTDHKKAREITAIALGRRYKTL